MQEEACRHTLSALHTMLRHAVHRALYGAHSTIVCLTLSAATCLGVRRGTRRPLLEVKGGVRLPAAALNRPKWANINRE